MSKKEKKPSFSKMLKDNAKKIQLQIGATVTGLNDAIAASVDGIVCTSIDSVVPVSVTEATENMVAGAKKLAIGTSYGDVSYSMYEFALKYPVKQTLVSILPASDIEDVFEGLCEQLEPLMGRSTLELVLDKIPEKSIKRMKNWANNPAHVPDMFVLRIPNLILFTSSIKKSLPSEVKTFDLVVLFVSSSKKLAKLKKKDKKEFERTVEFSVEKAVSVLKDFGSSCIHVSVDERFFSDPHDWASVWSKYLIPEMNEKSILSRVNFCTKDPDVLVQVQQQFSTDLIETATIELL